MIYERPTWPEEEYRDATDAVIDYGHRWGIGEGPRDDLYSVVTHPERFSPVVVVAEALIEHLVATYNVTVTTRLGTTILDPGQDHAGRSRG